MRVNDELVRVEGKWYLSVSVTLFLFLKSPGNLNSEMMRESCQQVINLIFCTFTNMYSSLFGHIKGVGGRIELDEFQTLFKGGNDENKSWWISNLRSMLLTQEFHSDCHQWQTDQTIDVHVACIALLSYRSNGLNDLGYM